jgi:hypothetical protein
MACGHRLSEKSPIRGRAAGRRFFAAARRYPSARLQNSAVFFRFAQNRR